MCKEDLNNEELIEEEYQETNLDNLSRNELLTVIDKLLESPKLDFDGLSSMDEFNDGIDKVADICGMYTALNTVGVEPNSIVDIILNYQNINYNIELNKMTCENNIKVAEKQLKLQKDMSV